MAAEPVPTLLTQTGYPLEVNGYEIRQQIGKGAFASVYSAVCKSKDNESVAIKVIELENEIEGDSGVNWDELQKEAMVMHRMQHTNVVGCLVSFVYKHELWLVMPLLSGGSCADIMKNTPKFMEGFKDEYVLATILRDILQGIAYCHEDGRIHRDIKAGNILLAEDGVAKLSDFGVSGALIEGGLKKHGRNTFAGSLLWMAPEVMQQEKGHNFKADIWSLGITALELAYGKPPHSEERPVKIMLTIMQMPPPTCDAYANQTHKFSKKFQNFIKLCLSKEPAKRPSAYDLLNNAFIRLARDPEYIVNNVLAERESPSHPSQFKLPRSISHKHIGSDANEQPYGDWNFSDRLSKNSLQQLTQQDSNDDDENINGEKVGRFYLNDQHSVSGGENNGDSNENLGDNSKEVQIGRFKVTT